MDSYDTEAVLIVEPPSHVRFRGPFNRPILSKISLINPTDKKIIFKIKTSAPAFYGVRPNFGVVQPRNFVEVEIARQPFNYDPKEKITHRFLIQSLAAPSEIEDISKYWKTADPMHLVSSKLRCVFEMPAEHTSDVKEEKAPELVIVTSTPKSEHKPDSQEVLLQKQIDSKNLELRELRIENNVLRKENAILRNEILQLHSMSARPAEPVKPVAVVPKKVKSISIIYVLLSIVLVLVCIMIGKFLA